MPITIGSNIAALRAQRELSKSSSNYSKALERLSSGMRINQASDDAAGLSIASALNADTRIFSQGIRNLNDGISLTSIYDSALDSLTSIVIRQKELATQSANGIYSSEERATINNEAEALTKEYNRITDSVEFNGIKLFEQNESGIQIQAGKGDEAIYNINLTSEINRKCKFWNSFFKSITIINFSWYK